MKTEVGASGRVVALQHTELSSAGYGKASFDGVYTVGTVREHSHSSLATVLSLLRPSGRLVISEPVAIPSAGEADAVPPGVRTVEDITRALSLAGFLAASVVSEGERAQALPVATYTLVAKKPDYEVGAAMSLKKKAKIGVEEKKAAVWVIDNADDDLGDLLGDDDTALLGGEVDGSGDALMDEEELLQEEDKIVTVFAGAENDDCEIQKGKRGACKNCTCGRAELEQDAEEAGVEVEAPKSSCGSCYLGDAFRCSTCPYLGMPAFKPGDKITIDKM